MDFTDHESVSMQMREKNGEALRLYGCGCLPVTISLLMCGGSYFITSEVTGALLFGGGSTAFVVGIVGIINYWKSRIKD